jgi:cell wall-associated NlpC family hydrolase
MIYHYFSNACSSLKDILNFVIDMQAIQLSLMQALIKIVTPASPAYGNTVAFERLETYQELQAKLQPGDVIFSRTYSTLYEIARKYMGISYDHVAVVINSKEGKFTETQLYISRPRSSAKSIWASLCILAENP